MYAIQDFLNQVDEFYLEENLIVKKVGLFATVFQGSDGKDTYYFNSQLFTKFM